MRKLPGKFLCLIVATFFAAGTVLPAFGADKEKEEES